VTRVPLRATRQVDADESARDMLETYRPLLFSIAYRMLGSATEAEDVTQEAFLRYVTAAQHDEAAVRSPKALLVTIATHLCLDQLKSARTRRERYIGEWLPEPVLTEDQQLAPLESVEQRESISLGFLVLLERLSPAERAVFVLREAFGYMYDEIGPMLARSGDACRQLHHRAVRRIAAGRARFESAPAAQRLLAEQFLATAQGGDARALADLLSTDAVLISDGGGKVAAAMRPIEGPDRIVRFLLGLMAKAPPNVRIVLAELNAEPGYVVFFGDIPNSAGVFDMLDGRIRTIRAIANPDKLAYVARQLRERLSRRQGAISS
jgi:RNA polymerase sigma-70 factor (TIGR02957 family)